jgi:valyl-tRNA synthetase
VQARWESAHLWEAEAKEAKTRQLTDKYLATFPYPYMNGVLHLGHGFTLAKVDFACAYQRLQGRIAVGQTANFVEPAKRVASRSGSEVRKQHKQTVQTSSEAAQSAVAARYACVNA